ncbi:MAG: hypothetical protein HYV63_20500 [Candidatus Schekmanbacteria bacterium]|nr:hypothetical protein [Candidatus Schekmanbacteria bacterium]
MNPTNRPILPAAPGTALPASTEDRHDWFSARAALITTTLCVAVFCLRVLARFSAFCVWDDAYMFTRYAENLLHGDFLAWNPGGPPVLGLTAPLYLILVAPLHYLVPASPGLAVWGASAIATGCFLVGLRFLLIRHGAGDPSTRRFGAVLVLFLLTVTSPELAALATSGMDTTFGLFWITATLLLALRLGATSGKAFARALGVVTALTFWARPDGVLFPLLVLGSLVRVCAPAPPPPDWSTWSLVPPFHCR